MTTKSTTPRAVLKRWQEQVRAVFRPGEDGGGEWNMEAVFNFPFEQMLADFAAALAEKPTTIVIGVEGGVVQGASCDGPVRDNIIVLDYDTEGSDDSDADRTVQIPDGEFTSLAYDIEPHMVRDAAFVKRVLDAIEKRDAALEQAELDSEGECS